MLMGPLAGVNLLSQSYSGRPFAQDPATSYAGPTGPSNSLNADAISDFLATITKLSL